MSLNNPYSLIELTNTELTNYISGLTDKQKQYLNEWNEDMLISSPQGCGDYKLELLLSKLDMLLNPGDYPEGSELPNYNTKEEETYKKNQELKLEKWYSTYKGPSYTTDESGEKTWQMTNNWKTIYWKKTSDGTKYDKQELSKYLPGPICKENWDKYMWNSTKYNNMNLD